MSTETTNSVERDVEIYSRPSGEAELSQVVVGDDPELVIVVPAEGKMTETAKALLDAAGDDFLKVQLSDGNFLVPQDIADKAKLPEGSEIDEIDEATGEPISADDEGDGEPEKKAAPAKKAPAKKAAPKKATK